MSDNILGLLLVTSSSRGRNVFRYPPDPTSPLARLSQPIYPVDLFTADYISTPEPPKHLLRNRSGFGAWDDLASSGFTNRSKKSNGSLAPPYDSYKDRRSPSIKSPLGSLRDKAKEMQRLAEMELGKKGENGEASDSDSQVSQDSDDELNDPNNSAGNSRISHFAGGKEVKDIHGNKDEGTVTFSTNPVKTRRSSSAKRRRPSRSRDRKAAEDEKATDEYDETQYHNSLNYSLDFLSDMLAPSRTACNRKFEICVDELVFVGHPVTSNDDGKWAYPTPEEEEADIRSTARGRRPKSHGPSHLGTVVEHGESSPDPSSSGPSKPSSPIDRTRDESTFKTRTDTSDDNPPELNMFNLVIILDKPDPKVGSTIESVSPMNLFDEVYKEIAFKWTAAAFELQVRDNYIAREAHEMAKIKEKCMAEAIPIRKCNKMVYDKCSLDRSLNQLYAEIYQLQNRVSNPLYANLPTTISASLADITFPIILSPRSADTDEAWAHWGEIDDHSSLSSLSDDEDWNDALVQLPPGGISSKTPDFKVEPWQTLLLLDDKAVEKSEEIAQGLYGLGVVVVGSRSPSGVVSAADSRRSSKDTSVEEDEGDLLKVLIEACDVSKTLANIAHLLRFDLEGIVIPLARELVQNKKAILIDPINNRLRTIVMPTTLAEQQTTWQDHSDRFATRFRTLPKLGTFLSTISEHPTHYRYSLPKEVQNQPGQKADERQTYFDALIWLMKNDLVIQVHIRARIYARPETKREAWLKLWHRRRTRWLAARERRSSISAASLKSPRSMDGSQISSDSRPSLSHSMTSDQITPRAVKTLNPLELLSTVPEPQQHGPMTMEQSYMDYDPELELDSDGGDGDGPQTYGDMTFSEDVLEPEIIPAFTGSFIFKPGRAQKDEARWLRVIREQGVSVVGERRDEVWASKFDLCVQYFDGIATFEEVVYRTGLPRRELDHLLELYKEDIITFIHP